VNSTDKNIFSIQARLRLVELGWSQVRLAKEIGCSREAVNRAIHTNKFPKVRRKLTRKIGLILPS